MSILVLGVSHQSAPIALLDEVALTAEKAAGLLGDLATDPRITEAMVLSTCNRLEVYAAVPRFHPAVECISTALQAHSRVSMDRLRPHLFVHHAERAAQHLFMTAAGLDSMVTGESQIRFQVKAALLQAREAGAMGATLGEAVETALRVGKRVQTETLIDRAGRSLADEGFAALAEAGVRIDGGTVVILGAGSMASVAAVAATRRGATDVVVINRDAERGKRLADTVSGVAGSWEDLPTFLGRSDVLVACTGAADTLVEESVVAQARASATGLLGVLDLAMPHDVDPAVDTHNGVVLVGLGDLAERIGDAPDAVSEAVARARAIVSDEVDAYVAAQSAAAVAPTVIALRQQADEVVAAELARLRNRLGDDLDDRIAQELGATVHRVVGKLLHTPTVRVKAAASEGSTDYEAALRHLFALDPGTGAAISHWPVDEAAP